MRRYAWPGKETSIHRPVSPITACPTLAPVHRRAGRTALRSSTRTERGVTISAVEHRLVAAAQDQHQDRAGDDAADMRALVVPGPAAGQISGETGRRSRASRIGEAGRRSGMRAKAEHPDLHAADQVGCDYPGRSRLRRRSAATASRALREAMDDGASDGKLRR